MASRERIAQDASGKHITVGQHAEAAGARGATEPARNALSVHGRSRADSPDFDQSLDQGLREQQCAKYEECTEPECTVSQREPQRAVSGVASFSRQTIHAEQANRLRKKADVQRRVGSHPDVDVLIGLDGKAAKEFVP